MTEKDKTKDQFGTYSEHVGEWTTGTGGGAGEEKTHISPVKENSTNENTEEADNQSSVASGESDGDAQRRA